MWDARRGTVDSTAADGTGPTADQDFTPPNAGPVRWRVGRHGKSEADNDFLRPSAA
ncbi:hypothetical protein EMIHUDRAFT_223343 [Emiliania huxleyi CCMP1516]|uniref:Uncharacterized protein n=2 Tax=Emiliania huxleyi TaxID=2903 RepID=A0A0D3KVM0_EMIH1|nr:hypothetical protein EMIHUDRAFT_223343 [Emiliania huxleyi CCMP1516]EOD39805.1 hypothetical protein EMIHUDRAFT_223343 [Emiliania huxleyi CCMP1516]|eukprot:XP_005792234.1 hypothetical protein EMIHUDRAFT_223343 [Emiliania huxleyi CCMP1516]